MIVAREMAFLALVLDISVMINTNKITTKEIINTTILYFKSYALTTSSEIIKLNKSLNNVTIIEIISNNAIPNNTFFLPALTLSQTPDNQMNQSEKQKL